jgi:predicted HAD superfamily Cof-like phosphohydrolase
MILELNQVRNFMIAFSQTTRNVPVTLLSESEKVLRVKLIQEELNELCEALNVEQTKTGDYAVNNDTVDPVAALDALTDLLYVIYGAYHTLGLAAVAGAAFTEVHNSNMSKTQVDGTVLRNAAGKVLKGSNYFPANLAQYVTGTHKI